MKRKGMRRLVIGGIALVAVLFILPGSLVPVITGEATAGTVVLFIIGLVMLASGLFLVGTGLIARSRDLRTPRSYDSREGSSSDEDRPANAHDMPTAGRQFQTGVL